MEENETSYDLEEEAADPEDMEGSFQEEPEADPDESLEEEAGEEQPEEDADKSEENSEAEAVEEDPEEDLEEDPETVSGNDIVISGDVVVFPEGYDLSDLEGEQLDTESIVQAIEKQDEILIAGFACTCFMLGVLAGAMIIAGFRLRRV